jgi:hypothetical protein
MTTALARYLIIAALSLTVSVATAATAGAQSLPDGSYRRTCTQIHWAGTTLVAQCRTADGRMIATGLPSANNCAGDIGNNNGQLQCTYQGGAQSPGSSPVPGGQPAPSQGYTPPNYGYGQPPPSPGYGYGQPPQYGDPPPAGPWYGPR